MSKTCEVWVGYLLPLFSVSKEWSNSYLAVFYFLEIRNIEVIESKDPIDPDKEYMIAKRVSPERRKENAKKVGKTDGIGDPVFGRGRIISCRAAGAGTG